LPKDAGNMTKGRYQALMKIVGVDPTNKDYKSLVLAPSNL